MPLFEQRETETCFVFYPRGASYARVLAVVACLCVCLSVCVCVCHTPVFYQMGAKYCAQRVCMFDCLFVCSHISETTCSNFTKFVLYVLPLPWLGPLLTAVRYVMYFRFSCMTLCEANGPESKTMRMSRPVRQVAVAEAKSAVSDCILLLTEKFVNLYSQVTSNT